MHDTGEQFSKPAASGGERFYSAFGLRIRSRLELPELPPVEPGRPDVDITCDGVPSELPDALARGVRYQASADRLLLQVDGVARYLVGGKRIAVEPAPGAHEDDVRVFLLGSVFGALLNQREDLVLHASAVATRGRCAVFLGFSGAGKSTLAAAFRQRGWRVVTDDLCVVRTGPDGDLSAYPGVPRIKLWLDSLGRLGIPAEGLGRIRREIEKRAVPLGADEFSSRPEVIARLYVLWPHNEEEVKLGPVKGSEKLAALTRHAYHFGSPPNANRKAGHFQQALKLGRQAPMARALRPAGSFRLDELVGLIEGDWKS